MIIYSHLFLGGTYNRDTTQFNIDNKQKNIRQSK